MSDWKEGAVKRRDARHIKLPDEPAREGVKGNPHPSAKKKDTKKWCKGKVGVEHKLVCRNYGEMKQQRAPGDDRGDWVSKMYKEWFVLCCTVCGKEVAHYYGKHSKKPKPDWVK